MTRANFYVYYRIDPGRMEELRAAVARVFDAVRARSGVQGRWLRRRDDAATCMEIYEAVEDADAFRRALEEEAARMGLSALLAGDGLRHVEVFVPLEDTSRRACA